MSWKKDSKGRIISILVRIGGFDLNFVYIYAPTNLTDRKSLYESLHEFFIPASALVIGGDLIVMKMRLINLAGKFLLEMNATF